MIAVNGMGDEEEYAHLAGLGGFPGRVAHRADPMQKCMKGKSVSKLKCNTAM
jgi:hypothetical protein